MISAGQYRSTEKGNNLIFKYLKILYAQFKFD